MSNSIYNPSWWYTQVRVAALLCLVSGVGLAKTEPYTYRADTVVAVGDIHGAYDAFVELLIANQLVDAQLHWTAGTTHFVSLGDLLDRGPKSRQVMDLLVRLQAEAAAAGGKVHVLLGNHEAMNLVGDLRNVSPAEYEAFANDPLPDGQQEIPGDVEVAQGFYQHRAAFSEEGHYGKWLLARPSLIKINDTVFVHGGLSPLVGDLGLTETNRLLSMELAQNLAIEADQQPLPSILDDPGPLWYRGTAACHALIEGSILTKALNNLGARRVVIGHTPTPTRKVTQRFDGRVVAIDTGMLKSVYKGQAFALELTGNQLTVLDSQGGRTDQVALFASIAKNWGDRTESEFAQQLSKAQLVSDPTAPDNYHVQDLQGGTHPAKFIKSSQKRAKAAEALWRLDRMLGLNMVPLTIARQVNGRWGYIDFSRGRWISETARQTGNLVRPNYCLEQSDYHLQAAFDLLTQGKLRRPEALSYQAGTWVMRLTDQHLSFPRTSKLIKLPQTPVIPELLLARLENLSAQTLQENIGSLIGARELKSVLDRRDKLLALIAKERT